MTVPLPALIGQNVRALRGDATQEDLALRVREAGLDWTRQSVNLVEHGRRDLRVGDLLLLCDALQVPLAKLLEGDGRVMLSKKVDADLDDVRKRISGADGRTLFSSHDVDDFLAHAMTDVRTRLKERQDEWERWYPQVLDEYEDGEYRHLDQIDRAADGLAEIAEARKFSDLDRFDIAVLAFGLWERSLTAERDARVSELLVDSSPTSRSLQAVRGHVTRRLHQELQDYREAKR